MRLPQRSCCLHTDAAGTALPDAFGAFRVLHQVGAGTLGPVFRAYDAERDRLVAVKLFRLDLPPHRLHQLVEEFEWLIAAEAVHPGLAAPIATGTDGITLYLVRDFVAADSLDVVVRDHGPAPAADALRVATELAEALDFAAAVGILHCGLHPRDVLISAEQARVIDLGVCAALEKVGVSVPVRRPYTAPERIAGASWDRRADVFGLSALVYELLWGRRPAASGAKVADGLTELPGADFEGLCAAFSRGLAAEPARRFDTAADFVAALTAAFPEVAHTPGRAAGPTRSVRAPQDVADARAAMDQSHLAPLEPRLPLDEPDSDRSPEPAESATRDLRLDQPQRLARPSPDERVDARLQSAEASKYVDVEEPVPAMAAGAPELRPALVPDTFTDSSDAATRSRPLWSTWSVAATLILGIGLGFGGGYLVGSRRHTELPPPSATAGPTSPDTTNGAAERRSDLAPPPIPAQAASEPRAVPPDASVQTSPKPAADEPGRLLVRSSPAGASVYVDGERHGLTPTAVKNLPTGLHRVRIVMDGYVAEDRNVTITEAKPAQAVTVELERPRAATQKSRASSEPASSPAFAGVLVVESRPAGAQVFVDGKVMGITPLVVAKVDAGEHVVRLERDGYRRWSASVRIVAGERNRVTASLER